LPEDCNAVVDCGAYLQGAVIVSKDLEGILSVERTDVVREGAEGLSAVGFAVGLFGPPLAAATAIGARPASCRTTSSRTSSASMQDRRSRSAAAGQIVA
jgi:hypothetical protein